MAPRMFKAARLFGTAHIAGERHTRYVDGGDRSSGAAMKRTL